MSRPARRHPLRGRLLLLGEAPIETTHGPFRVLIARNVATGAAAFAVHRGDVTAAEPLLARIHSSCVTSETFGGCDCDCVEQVDAALARIAARGRGVLFYLMQEGRGAGFAAKARDRMLVQASGNRLTTFEAYARMGLDHDCRRYEEVGDLCRLLGVRAPLVLLTSNPDKLEGLRRDADVAIVDVEPLAPSPSPWNSHYIAAKSRSGHSLADPAATPVAAQPPEHVEAFEPYALADDDRFVHLATYQLPIRDRSERAPAGRGAPSWFRLHAYADLVSRTERVVLAYGRDVARATSTPAASATASPTRTGTPSPSPAQSPVLVRVQRESLLERFPLAGGGREKSFWHRAVRRIVDHGAGCATFLPSTGFDARLEECSAALDPGIALLAHHLHGRAVRLLLAEGGDPRREARVAARAHELFARAGVQVLEPEPIDAMRRRSARPVASAVFEPESADIEPEP